MKQTKSWRAQEGRESFSDNSARQSESDWSEKDSRPFLHSRPTGLCRFGLMMILALMSRTIVADEGTTRTSNVGRTAKIEQVIQKLKLRADAMLIAVAATCSVQSCDIARQELGEFTRVLGSDDSRR